METNADVGGIKLMDSILRRLGLSPEAIPESFTFGDGINWESEVNEAFLYVELPFWLMMPAGDITIEYQGTKFEMALLPPWQETFLQEVTDSKKTVAYQGPESFEWKPEKELAKVLAERHLQPMSRPCHSMLRLKTRAHSDAFEPLSDAIPRLRAEKNAYHASLCAAHLPVVNELIQRYRLHTYDYFAYEVSPWDVPTWYLKQGTKGVTAQFVLYKEFDVKPVIVNPHTTPDGTPILAPVQWCELTELEDVSSDSASAGEFDLLDARSLMERGDYTGAVRRTTTAIEALIGSVLETELNRQYDASEVARRLNASKNDVPGRIAQWRKLTKSAISQSLFDEYEKTRSLRHEIVHRARRLGRNDRGMAQRMVDTGRWLYNQIEAKPDRTRLRDKDTRKSIGRSTIAILFPTQLTPQGYILKPIA